MRMKLLITSSFVLGAIAGSVWNDGHANAEGLRNRRVVATVAKDEFNSRDGNGVRIEHAVLEDHDVWMSLGYLKFSLTHHPDCERCAAEEDGADAFASAARGVQP